MSSSVPCAPSNITRLPAPIAAMQKQRRVGDERLQPRPRAAADRRARPATSCRRCRPAGCARRRSRAPRSRARRRPTVGQIADANAAPADLVLVGRADAARRRADLPLAAARFGQHVELAVIRQDQVRLVAHEQPAGRRRRRAPSSSSSSANSACGSTTTPLPMMQTDARMQDARRNQMQDEFLPADVHRVTRVVSALIARDDAKSAASAGRRSCLCLHRPTGRRARTDSCG